MTLVSSKTLLQSNQPKTTGALAPKEKKWASTELITIPTSCNHLEGHSKKQLTRIFWELENTSDECKVRPWHS
jgi:hypothetical protein